MTRAEFHEWIRHPQTSRRLDQALADVRALDATLAAEEDRARAPVRVGQAVETESLRAR